MDDYMRDNPEREKPDDWDNEEDSEWEISMKDHSAYKGDWSVNGIENSACEVIWEAEKSANPESMDDDKLCSYTEFNLLSFGLWQAKGGTTSDNTILCNDPAETDEFAKQWKALSEAGAVTTKENKVLEVGTAVEKGVGDCCSIFAIRERYDKLRAWDRVRTGR